MTVATKQPYHLNPSNCSAGYHYYSLYNEFNEAKQYRSNIQGGGQGKKTHVSKLHYMAISPGLPR